jgi:hypothetical protein
MIVVGVLAIAAGFLIGALVSSWNARRVHDRGLGRIVELLCSPLARIGALLKRQTAMPRWFEMVDRGRRGEADFDLLVVSFDGPPAPLVAALETVRHQIGRLVIGRVMPPGGGRALERLVADDLRVDRSILGFPDAELMLLFGSPADVISDFARTERMRAVVVDREIPELTTRLEGSGVVLLSISEGQVTSGPAALRARRCEKHTRLRLSIPAEFAARASWN